MKRIHIVGCGPRTGTTLLAEMMIACFEIDAHTRHEDSLWTRPPRKASIFLTKRPRDILYARPALRIVPDLHVIYMLRDPRDTIVSKHGKDPDRYWAGLTYWKTYSLHGRRLSAHPNFITVRYEDLVTKPDEIQDNLVERMPFLRQTARFSQYSEVATPSADSLEALGIVRPPSASGIGNWRRHLDRVAGQLQIHGPITQDLIDFGYEPDDGWLRELEGVTPDVRPGHLDEQYSKRLLLEIALTRHWKAILLLIRTGDPFGSIARALARASKR